MNVLYTAVATASEAGRTGSEGWRLRPGGRDGGQDESEDGGEDERGSAHDGR